jgi:hypothetical protein
MGKMSFDNPPRVRRLETRLRKRFVKFGISSLPDTFGCWRFSGRYVWAVLMCPSHSPLSRICQVVAAGRGGSQYQHVGRTSSSKTLAASRATPPRLIGAKRGWRQTSAMYLVLRRDGTARCWATRRRHLPDLALQAVHGSRERQAPCR